MAADAKKPRGRAGAFAVARSAGRQVGRLLDGGVGLDEIDPDDVARLLYKRGPDHGGWSHATYYRKRREGLTTEDLRGWTAAHAPTALARARLAQASPLRPTDQDLLLRSL